MTTSTIAKMALSRHCKALALERKVLLIKEVKKRNKAKSGIVKKFGVPASTLFTILNNKKILDGFEQSFSSNRKKVRSSKLSDGDAALLGWFKNAKFL